MMQRSLEIFLLFWVQCLMTAIKISLSALFANVLGSIWSRKKKRWIKLKRGKFSLSVSHFLRFPSPPSLFLPEPNEQSMSFHSIYDVHFLLFYFLFRVHWKMSSNFGKGRGKKEKCLKMSGHDKTNTSGSCKKTFSVSKWKFACNSDSMLGSRQSVVYLPQATTSIKLLWRHFWQVFCLSKHLTDLSKTEKS